MFNPGTDDKILRELKNLNSKTCFSSPSVVEEVWETGPIDGPQPQQIYQFKNEFAGYDKGIIKLQNFVIDDTVDRPNATVTLEGSIDGTYWYELGRGFSPQAFLYVDVEYQFFGFSDETIVIHVHPRRPIYKSSGPGYEVILGIEPFKYLRAIFEQTEGGIGNYRISVMLYN